MWILYTNHKGYLCTVPETRLDVTIKQIKEAYPPLKYFEGYLQNNGELTLLKNAYAVKENDTIFFTPMNP